MSFSSPDDLRLILEVPADVSDDALQAFLDDANLLVTETLTGRGLSNARLKAIEKWVGAHFAVQLTERGGLTSSRTGQSQENYTTLSPLGSAQIGGLQLTRYGQQALILDTTGTLLAASKQNAKARISVYSEFDEETPVITP